MFLENFDFVLKGHLLKRTQNSGNDVGLDSLIWERNSKYEEQSILSTSAYSNLAVILMHLFS